MPIDQFKCQLLRTTDGKYFRLWHISALVERPDSRGTYIHLNGGFAIETVMPLSDVVNLIESALQ